MKIKGFLQDVGGAGRVTARRQEVFDNASATPKPFDPISKVVKLLHPGFIPLKVVSIKDASITAKTVRFESEGHIPYFKAGQFLTLIFNIGESVVTRPYSISSAPYETRGDKPFVEITVRKSKGDGFIADYIYDNVKVGDVYIGEVGLGEFHYDYIRDAKHVVALAGGSGITPFLSMAREIKFGKLDTNLTIIYGSVAENDIILKDELAKCECDKVKIVHVLSGENPGWKGEKGFINKDIIKKYSSKDTTYFVCGPQVMYDFIKGELEAIGIEKRRIRFEVFGQPRDLTKLEGFPLEQKDNVYTMTVCQGISKHEIAANASETIAVALERAGLKIHTACRSGSCGCCRIKVLYGTYYVPAQGDGRRKADKDFNYVHACSTYPTSNITIKLNID